MMRKLFVHLCWIPWIPHPLVSFGEAAGPGTGSRYPPVLCARVDVDMLLFSDDKAFFASQRREEAVLHKNIERQSWQILEAESENIVARGVGSWETSGVQWLAVGSYHLELAKSLEDDFVQFTKSNKGHPRRHGSSPITSVQCGIGVTVGGRFAGFVRCGNDNNKNNDGRFTFQVLSTDCDRDETTTSNHHRRLQDPSSTLLRHYPSKIIIIADSFPQEISWTLYKKETEAPVDQASGADDADVVFQPVLQGGAKSQSTMLLPGTYDFQMTDTAGDGLCCSFNVGSFLINVNGQTAYRGAEFDFATAFMEFTLLEDGQLRLPSPLPSSGDDDASGEITATLQPSPEPTMTLQQEQPSRSPTFLPTSAAPTTAIPTTTLPTTVTPTTVMLTTVTPTTTSPMTTIPTTTLPSTKPPTTSPSMTPTRKPEKKPPNTPPMTPTRKPKKAPPNTPPNTPPPKTPKETKAPSNRPPKTPRPKTPKTPRLNPPRAPVVRPTTIPSVVPTSVVPSVEAT